jgi:stringent starvation protein B
MSSEASPQKPYLLRAMHEWMSDNNQTPHIVVDVSLAGVDVPQHNVRDGKIVLNVGYAATQNLILGNDEITFDARFDGKPHHVRIPSPAVLAIYARESSQGMVFSGEVGPAGDDQLQIEKRNEERARPDKSHLRVIK